MKQHYKKISILKEKKLHNGADVWSNTIIGKIKNIFVTTNRFKNDAKIIHKLSLKYNKLSDKDLDILIIKYHRIFKLNKESSNE